MTLICGRRSSGSAGTDPLGAETDGDGTPDASDPEPLEGVIFWHGDQLGSVVSLRAADGSVIEQGVYRPYGATAAATAGTPATTPAFGFTGQRYEASVGLYDYGARWYDPRWAASCRPMRSSRSRSLRRVSTATATCATTRSIGSIPPGASIPGAAPRTSSAA